MRCRESLEDPTEHLTALLDSEQLAEAREFVIGLVGTPDLLLLVSRVGRMRAFAR